MSASLTDTHARSPTGIGRLVWWFLGFCAIVVLVALLLPAIQGPRKWRPSQAWKNLRQIRLAIENYCYANGSLPYDPKGPEYALYVLCTDLPASCFDSYPHKKPDAEARWDHAEKRLVGSDFEYINLPDIDRWSGQMIVLAEKPHESYRSIMLLRCDGYETQCEAPSGSSREVLGNWDSSDNFLFKDYELFRKWESVPLPRTDHGYTTATSEAAEGSIWNSRVVHRSFGRINVYYEYQQGEIVRRIFDSPEGKITDVVTTDELGRIVAFTRNPGDWESFWPVDREQESTVR